MKSTASCLETRNKGKRVTKDQTGKPNEFQSFAVFLHVRNHHADIRGVSQK
jgi:hypothetical protein